MWKKRILPLLCALALLAGLLPGRVQAAQTKPVRYLTVTGTPAQLETGRRLPQATPELASDAGAALHLTQGRWYNSITALQQGDPLPDGASVFGTGAYYLGLELKADDGWALTDETRLCINRSANAALYTRQGATLLAICYRSQGDPETLPLSGSTAPFSDLAPTDWYYSAAIYTYRLGLLQGTSATAFSPHLTTTRAMLVTILHRLAGTPQPRTRAAFQDVPAGTWYTDAVAWAAEQGIVYGYSAARFGPDDPVTRQQAVTFLYRYAALQGCSTVGAESLRGFADTAAVADWARDAFAWAVCQGILSGIPQGGALYLAPECNALRAQLAVILQEFFDLAVCQSAQQPGLTVGYIPLDNRPVNDLRPVLQAQSAGLRVRMPREALYATRLDNQSPTANGTTYGARQALLDWLHRNADACDILVISLDQLLSGGLVSSRALQGGDLQFEYEAIDYLSDLARQKPVYVFDTVMRLASTVGYQGLTGADYVAYRNYGMQPRQSLTGNALTPEAIAAGYRFDASGAPIATRLTDQALDAYHAARLRKLRLGLRLLERSAPFAGVLIGVDDSHPGSSIQTNEIALLQQHLGKNGALFCGADELGMMAICQAYCTAQGGAPRLAATYFGPCANEPADDFDTTTLRQAVQQHMDALGTASSGSTVAQVLLLTKGSSQQDADALLAAWQANDRANIPTIVIDVSGGNRLTAGLLQALPVRSLMGYSSWGTTDNAVGIALSMGLTRLCYLRHTAQSQDACTAAFCQSLTFALVKDIAYCKGCRSAVQDLTPAGLQALVCGDDVTKRLLSALPGKAVCTAQAGDPAFAVIPSLTLTNFSAPFARRYEIRFQVVLG